MKKVYNVHWLHKKKMFTNDKGERHTVSMYDERNQKFYSSAAWLELRDRFRKSNPICARCKEEGRIEPTEVIDHIISITDDWNLRLDEDNLQALCNHHHIQKTIEDMKIRREKQKQAKIKAVMDDLNNFE